MQAARKDVEFGYALDLSRCIGCRRCEFACGEQNELPHGALGDYDDQSVFEAVRSRV